MLIRFSSRPGRDSVIHIPSRILLSFAGIALLCLFDQIPGRKIRLAVAAGPLWNRALTSFNEKQASSAAIENSLEAALAEHRTSEAESWLRQLLKQTSISSDILLKAGIALAQNSLYDDAALAFQRCVEASPEIFESHYDLALAEFARQRYPQALAALRDARAHDRNQRLALFYMRGKIENALGHPREAGRDLAAAFTGDPEQENYALDFGLYDLQQNAYPQAAKIFAQARALHPDSVFAGVGLALAQYLSGRIPECIRTCQQLSSQRPTFGPAQLLLAFALVTQGKLREAEEAARKGLEDSAADPYLNYMDVATMLKLRSSDFSRMLREIAVAERQIPACSLCYLAQSKIDDARGAKKAAIQDLEKAVSMDPRFSDAWYRLAALEDQMGQHEKALQARKRFQSLKVGQSQRETDMLRSAFIRALATSNR